jgi:hypothetical protein
MTTASEESTMTLPELQNWLAAQPREALEDRLGPSSEWCDGRILDCTETMIIQFTEVCGFLRAAHPHFRRLLPLLAHDEDGAFSHVEIQAKARVGSGTVYVGVSADLDGFFVSEPVAGQAALWEVTRNVYDKFEVACLAAQQLETVAGVADRAIAL